MQIVAFLNIILFGFVIEAPLWLKLVMMIGSFFYICAVTAEKECQRRNEPLHPFTTKHVQKMMDIFTCHDDPH